MEQPSKSATSAPAHDLATRLQRISALGERNAYFWREGVRWRRRSFAQLHGRIHASAARLAKAGAGPDSPILIQGPAGPDWVEALLGAFLLGAIVVPLDEASPEDFRFEVARRSKAQLLVAPRSLTAPPGCARVEMGDWPVTRAPDTAWEMALPASPPKDRPAPAGSPAPVSWDPARTAELVFTSGTTGEPKGVVLTHGNLASDFYQVEKAYLKWEAYVRPFGELRMLTTLPLSHMFGQAMNVFLPLFMGLTVVLVPPRPRDVLEAAPRLRAWGLFTVPRLLDVLSAEVRRRLRDEGRLESFHKRQERFADSPFYLQALMFPHLRRLLGWRFLLLVSGGAALPQEVQRFWERSGYLVVQGYGLTETAPVISISNPFDRSRPGSVGKPLGIQEVKLGPGGEVWVKGPNVTPGYLGVGGVGDAEGWFHTGDVGELDEKGHLRIRGRVKDVIVTAEGENVFPGDVEAALSRAPGVREACVLGVPGPGGDRVHAVLMLEPGADAEACVSQANASLQPKQRIKDYTVWKEGDFPRTATGKIRKGILLEKILATQTEGVPAEQGHSTLTQGVRRLVARVAQIDPARVESGTRLVEGLGLASLDLVELAAAFEEEYGVILPEERLNEATVGDLEQAVQEVTRAPRPSQSTPSADPSTTQAIARGVAQPQVPGANAGSVETQEGAMTSTETPSPASMDGGSASDKVLEPSDIELAGTDTRFPEEQATLVDRDEAASEVKSFAGAMQTRGRRPLPMPRWARWAPVRWLRRLIEELVQRPFVYIFTRPRVIGRQHLREAQPPFLFVANHLSYMDTGLFKVALPFSIRGRIAPGMTTRYHRVYYGEIPGSRRRYLKERFQIHLVEFFWGAWPLPETARFRDSLSYAGELADAGESLLIFPEGRHLREGDMGPFRGGIGIFARDLRMPVIPVYVEGTKEVLPDEAYWPRFGKTKLVLGAPIHFEPDADPAEITHRLEEAVRKLMWVTTGIEPRTPSTPSKLSPSSSATERVM
jgi:long-chain acyl-CoA synthetase